MRRGTSPPTELVFPVAARLVLPRADRGPLLAVLRRVGLAAMLLLAVVAVVHLGREGYRDGNGDGVSLLDAFYYATVSLSTTGYGDITPVSDQARLMDVLVVTPLRVLFLIVLVGTTLEVLTERTREQWRQSRWRRTVQAHTLVIGYGTKGRSAARALLDDGYPAQRIVVVDPDSARVAEAAAAGLVGVCGDATRSAVLRQAEVDRAERVLVAADRDDSAVLAVLTVRQHNPGAYVVAAVREAENAPLLRQSGADSVVVSSEAAGRLIGLSAINPRLGTVFEDLLVPQHGLELAERPVAPSEVDRPARDSDDLVVAVLRGSQVHRFGSEAAQVLRRGDRVVVVADHPEAHRTTAPDSS